MKQGPVYQEAAFTTIFCIVLCVQLLFVELLLKIVKDAKLHSFESIVGRANELLDV